MLCTFAFEHTHRTLLAFVSHTSCCLFNWRSLHLQAEPAPSSCEMLCAVTVRLTRDFSLVFTREKSFGHSHPGCSRNTPSAFLSHPQAEPSEEEESAVSIRARLPDGSSHVRRFGAASPVAEVRQWVQGLESMPLWDPTSWSLVSSFPRAVLDPRVTVGDCAVGCRQVMVFVERAGSSDVDA